MKCGVSCFRKLALYSFLLLSFTSAFSQTYILNEDFSVASGTIPPVGWVNRMLSGETTDLWHFDNPGTRTVNYPIIGRFAIFDSENISTNDSEENVILETPYFDATISQEILFSFDHYFQGGDGASATIEVYDGDQWHVIKTFTDTTNNSEKEILNISAFAGGIPNAKIRFRWQGDGFGLWAIDNISIYTPLPTDAGITRLDSPVMPFAAGAHPIAVTLANFGANTITTTTINWTVNAVAQTPFAWTGSLSSGTKQAGIVIGNYSFISGKKTIFRIWSTTPNGEADGYALNDTLNKTLYTALCGTYTVGGTDPDFKNFTEVATALNNAGITCPVIFKVRDGVYDEQIKLYQISGSSATNTITFMGESGDSSKVTLHYKTSNPSNDFTLALTGTDFIAFKDMGVLRTNGTNSVLIQGESNHVRFESCRLGHVVSPASSVDGNLTFRFNNMEGYDLNLQQSAGAAAQNIVVEYNQLRDLNITNSAHITVIGNKARQLYFTSGTIINVNNNIINCPYSGLGNDIRGIFLSKCVHASCTFNTITVYGNFRAKGVEVSNSSDISCINNTIRSYAYQIHSMGVTVNGKDSRTIRISHNDIVSSYCYNIYENSMTKYGIYADNGDSIFISNNHIQGLAHDREGIGIALYNIVNVVEADSNTIENFKTKGIHASTKSNQWKIRYNTIKNAQSTGIYIEGTGGAFTHNKIQGITAGNGIHILASGATVTENKTSAVVAGTGIIVNGPNSLVANNFIQVQGLGIAKGISLQSNGSGSKIVFNSVNITGTDVANGVGLEVLGGSGYTVKNNIFANNGGGYASFFTDSLKGDFDYNNYFSTKRKLAHFINADYSDLTAFRSALKKEVHGFAKNPFYCSDTLLQMNQVLLNDAAQSGTGITNDIDATVRGSLTDLGAKEYTPCSQDAGVNEFTGLINPLPVGNQPVKVELQNQGTNTLTSAVIHWEVNGVAQAPYTWTGSLSYKAHAEVTVGNYTFQGGESYKLKTWTVSPSGGADCDHYNDTAMVFDLATPLCGIYTIGGTDPDFTSFTDAATALNNAGITCPVIFKVRDGVYDEQIKLYQISGSSATNTITFMGESGDSSKVTLHYKTSNPSNDFTLALTGTDFIAFKDMGVLRTNGTNSVLIQGESNHVRFESCRLGHVVSPASSVDGNLTFRFNNMEGYDLNLQQSAGAAAQNIVVEYNQLRDLNITNSAHITVIGNKARQLYFTSGTIINVNNNIINCPYSGLGNDIRGIFLSKCVHASCTFNTITVYGNFRAKGVEVSNSSDISCINNTIRSYAYQIHSMGVTVNGKDSRTIRISHNDIVSSYCYNIYENSMTKYGIYADNGDSIFISNNHIQGLAHDREGIGIALYNIVNVVEADSNTIENFKTKGIHASTKSNQWKIRYNTIKNAQSTGIYIEGTGGAFTHNKIQGITAGNGIHILASGATVTENKTSAVVAGTGIIVNGPNSLVANNFIQVQGLGIAKGISLQSNGSGSKIVFNSVNITGTDVANGVGLEVLGGSGYTVKNNIFANNGGGYASFFTDSLKGDFDYNNYFSTKRKLAHFINADYSDLTAFRSALKKEVHGFAKNPFYCSDTLLQMNQVLLNDAAQSGTGITNDIDATVRGSLPDLGAKEYTPCSQDAGVNEFTGLINPLPVGNQPVKVELQNQGTNTLTSAVIHWEVNGVAQAPYTWTGSLSYKAHAEVTVGNYTFQGGESYKLKTWTVSPSGGADCDHYNDTAMVFDLATPLCGIYTIGGTDPDFTSFTDAATALNNAGITCPVIFKVRDGVYDEQIKLYQISGSSATNTITFMGESGDSSKVTLHYKTSNPSNDFTLALTGTDFIAFKDMGVLRTNGTNSVLIQGESNHVRFESCRLGHVVSPASSVDGNLTFRFNNMEGYDLNLQQSAGAAAQNIVVEYNQLRDLNITNSAHITVIGNKARQLYFTSGTIINVYNNIINCPYSGLGNDIRGIFLSKCVHASCTFNTITVYGNFRVKGVEISNSSDISCINNTIRSYAYQIHSMGVTVNGKDSRTIRISHNDIISSYCYIIYENSMTKYGIYADNGDSIFISNNHIQGLAHDREGIGIALYNIVNVVEADSNTIENFKTKGIHASTKSNQWKIRYNTIKNAQSTGIYIEGTGGAFTHNKIQGITAGNGIHILASGATVTENKTSAVVAGTGIIVNGPNSLVANNFIQVQGLGIAKGISLQSNGSGSKIVFNSVNITGTDVANGVGLEVLGGSGYTVKNNIFANNGGGLAARLDKSIAGSDWDYNDYYSEGDEFGSYLGARYSDLFSWGAFLNADANSKILNPFYLESEELRPNQRALNGAGIASSNILLDIDGEIRNQSAPDVGADEYLVDFGITQLLSPTLHCGHSTNDSVTVMLRQFGDVPFTNLRVAYQVNNGTIDIDTIPGQLVNDIVYTFNSTQNLTGHGSYTFKIWLIGSYDDNINNDTLVVKRYSSDIPEVNFSFTSDCAGSSIPFTGTANVSSGIITGYEWLFNDGDTALVQNPTHVYDTSGLYHVTLRAYTNIGCYGDTTKEVNLLLTPMAGFESGKTCYSEEVVFNNLSTAEEGALSYYWKFGDGTISTEKSPSHLYAQAGKYLVELSATASSGCSDTRSDSIEIFSAIVPNLSNQADTLWCNPSGGAGPYTVVWNNGKTGNKLTGLMQGWYTATVTDFNGCTATDSIEVILPELQYLITGVDATCSGCANGKAFVIVSQGVPPYYIQWSTGSTSDSITGLLPGTYSVIVRDAFLNEKADSIIIEGIKRLSLSLNPVHPACYGATNGAIDMTITGGQAPYSIQWSNGATSEDLSSLAAGTYNVKVTDVTNAIDTMSIELTAPAPMNLVLAARDVSCSNADDGSISVSISGGTAPYSYAWDNGDTTQKIMQLPAGKYRVSVSDASGCSAVNEVELSEPEALFMTVKSISPTCSGNANGSAMAEVTGGTLPYSYKWSNNSTLPFVENLSAGSIYLTVTDQNGCSLQSHTELIDPEPVKVTGIVKDVICRNAANGRIDLTVTGGSPAYTYQWSNGNTVEDVSGLKAGNYSVTVKDANGCNTVKAFTVSQPVTSIAINTAVNNVLCTGNATGSIQLTVNGGVSPYRFNWSDGSSSPNISGLTAGLYKIVVTDANGCTAAKNLTVSEPAIPLTATGNITDARCSGENTGNIQLTVYGGVLPYRFNWSNGTSDQNLTSGPVGMYSVMITDNHDCMVSWSGEIKQVSNAALSGIVLHSNGFVDSEDADVVLMDASVTPYKTVQETRTQANGRFEFTEIPSGAYVVYVKLDDHAKQKYQGVMHSYYNLTHKWAEAQIINLSCGDDSSITMNMFENPAVDRGNGKISGTITYDGRLLKATSPPVTNATVLLINESTQLPVDFVETNEAGYYELTGIATGTYSIYVDIAGLEQESTYQIIISDTSLVYKNLDFVVDIDIDYSIKATRNNNSHSDSETAEDEVMIFPNPARDYFELHSATFRPDGLILMFSQTGALIKSVRITSLQSDEGVVKIDLVGVYSGTYIVKMDMADSVLIRKVIVVNQ